MSELISRSALLAAINASEPALPDEYNDIIHEAPAITPRVAVSINGGACQWALANMPGVRVHIVDFDNEGTTGFELDLVRDKDGNEDPANAYEEDPEVQPAYFDMLDCSPTVNEDGDRLSAEPDPTKFHIVTDVMQCGPDGVHESFEGYHYASCEKVAVAQHELELRFYFGEYKTGPAGRRVTPPHA